MANIRLKDFPAKVTPADADLIYGANSAAADREIKFTVSGIVDKVASDIIPAGENRIAFTDASGDLTNSEDLKFNPLTNSLSLNGTVTNGIWGADVVAGEFGGTGLSNPDRTILLEGDLEVESSGGAHTLTLRISGNSVVTFPTGSVSPIVNGQASATLQNLNLSTSYALLLGATEADGIKITFDAPPGDGPWLYNIPNIGANGAFVIAPTSGIVQPASGGTGVNNGVHTITLGGTLETNQNVEVTGALDLTIDSSVADTLTFNTNIKFFDDAQNVGVGSVFPNITSGSTNLAIGKNCGVNITSGTGNFFIGNNCDVPGGQGAAQYRIGIGNGIIANYNNTMTLGDGNITAIVNQTPNNCSLGTTNQTFKSIIFGTGPGDNVEVIVATRATFQNAKGTIPDTGGDFNFQAETIVAVNAAAQTIHKNCTYYTEYGSGQVVYTLPASADKGDSFRIRGSGGGTSGWKIAQTGTQTIHWLAATTTAGSGGSITSSNQYDCIDVSCITAGTTATVWLATNVEGIPVVV